MRLLESLGERERTTYLRLLSAVAKLSGLFSTSNIPYINYRVAEHVFCRSFGADNLSRSDTAFDARIGDVGIGIKTFTCQRGESLEKVAEFNALSHTLVELQDKPLELVERLSQYRNERIDMACRLYGLKEGYYHIIARAEGQLILFDTDYSHIHLEGLRGIKQSRAGIQFSDGYHDYAFNHSKSTLFRRFKLPQEAQFVPVSILDNPYDLLLALSEEMPEVVGRDESEAVDQRAWVVLPLYSTRGGEKSVPERSGLNQWNARGRPRDFGELYIPVPRKIHQLRPEFFPSRDTPFKLRIPTGEVFDAKICQDGGKALMTNPNKQLSDWLLRELFGLKEGELLSYERMQRLGFDSVVIYKEQEGVYAIDKAKSDSYELFVQENLPEP